jgi:hypothetical protein
MNAILNSKKNIENTNINKPKPAYKMVNKIAGIKVQENGSLTRPDDIYDIQVSDFVVEIDRLFLSNLSNKDRSDMIEEGINSCKEQLKAKGLKVLGSHMQSHPPKDEPHISLSVVSDEKLNTIVDNMNKVRIV